MSAFAEEVRDNLTRCMPNDSFQVIHAPNYCVSSFNGDLILKCRLDDDQHLLLMKMRTSTGPRITNDELYQAAFLWVYDSRKIKDVDQRRDFIKDKLNTRFPQYFVLVMLFKSGQPWCVPYAKAKASAVYIDDSGDHDVIVVLY